MRVSYHINVGPVTHGQIAFSAHQQLARLNAVDRAGSTGQRHRLVDCWVVAHDRDAADLQAQTALFLRCAEQPRILAPIALRVLLHAALGATEYANLEGALRRDQTAIIAAAAHNCRCSGCRYGRAERRRS